MSILTTRPNPSNLRAAQHCQCLPYLPSSTTSSKSSPSTSGNHAFAGRAPRSSTTPRLAASVRDLKFRPLFDFVRQEVLKQETKIASTHIGELLNVADVGRVFPTAAMIWKAERPEIAGLGFATESGMKPRVVGFSAEDGQRLTPFLDAKVAEASMSLQRALKILGGRFDVHKGTELRKLKLYAAVEVDCSGYPLNVQRKGWASWWFQWRMNRCKATSNSRAELNTPYRSTRF